MYFPVKAPIRDYVPQQAVSSFFAIYLFYILYLSESWRNYSNIHHEINCKLLITDDIFKNVLCDW